MLRTSLFDWRRSSSVDQTHRDWQRYALDTILIEATLFRYYGAIKVKFHNYKIVRKVSLAISYDPFIARLIKC